ncbi:hypothetical protein Tcan_10306 [Toxocara canis]|uniref:Pepsin inhibitor-3-like repeated domain-containing protein n=1 Tax=Toxocara canis TaxID=6265 RepID=A0A0B2W029_TOXCA|nr:hypothetical protein Tcan_10306 [Toxocara canis]
MSTVALAHLKPSVKGEHRLASSVRHIAAFADNMRLLIIASAITIVLAHPLSSERNVQVYEVDDEKFGCRVEDGKKLFFDEIFIRELTEKEQEENAKYEELLKEHVEGFDKAAEVAPTDENGLLDLSNADFPSVPEEPSFCTALVKVELDGCFALVSPLLTHNVARKKAYVSDTHVTFIQENVRCSNCASDDYFITTSTFVLLSMGKGGGGEGGRKDRDVV